MLNVGPGSWSKIKIFGGPWVLSVIEGPKSALRQKYIEHNKRVQVETIFVRRYNNRFLGDHSKRRSSYLER